MFINLIEFNIHIYVETGTYILYYHSPIIYNITNLKITSNLEYTKLTSKQNFHVTLIFNFNL